MKNDFVISKLSKIHGKGVFASKNFKKGEIVLHWDTSQIISKIEFENLNQEEKKYICLINDKFVIMQEPEKYVNHSCDANTKSENFCDIAKRDILKGEEITGNYRETSLDGLTSKCNCGNLNCCKK